MFKMYKSACKEITQSAYICIYLQLQCDIPVKIAWKHNGKLNGYTVIDSQNVLFIVYSCSLCCLFPLSVIPIAKK